MIYQNFSKESASGSTHNNNREQKYFDFLCFRKHDRGYDVLYMLIRIDEYYDF